MSDLVTVGESTALFSAPSVGRLRDAKSLDVSIAGAESNVSIGFARLERSSSWIGRVGDDEFGKLILKTLRAEGVDVTSVVTDGARQTALMFKERSDENVVKVSYYRSGYAGSALCPDDLDVDALQSARILHVTGITLALGDSARATVLEAIRIARSSGVTVSLDFNYRSRLWSREQATSVIRPVVDEADIVFSGEDELFILGGDDVDNLKDIAEGGRREVVVKRGSKGASSYTKAGILHEPGVRVHAVDPVGAGDAFVAGYLVALLDGADPAGRLRLGCACGAFAASRFGDWECLPRRDDLDVRLMESGTTLR